MNRSVIGVITAFVGCLVWDVGKRISTRHNRGIARGKRFLILGGGFAGVEAGRELERLLPGDDNGEITLVDQNGYLLFTPMLTEAVGGNLELSDIAVPLRHFVKRADIVQGEVKSIDLHARTASVDGDESRTFAADHIILCLGANSSYHHVPGAEQNSVPMKRLSDARLVRDAALGFVKKAAEARNGDERRAMLTFLVAGGGYTGVETIAALNELVRQAAKNYESLQQSDIAMIIAEPMDRIMNEVTEDLAAYTQRELERAGIEVLVKTGVKSVEGENVLLANGRHIRTKTFVWTAGVEANKLVASLDAPKGKSKGLKVTHELAVARYPGVWAIGDCAEVPRPDGNGTYGATAQNATREGKLVAQNIVRQLRRQAEKPFTYRPIGELALVGRRRGVARIYGHNFSGFVAYLLWRGIYIAKLPSMAQRLRVLSDWALDALLGPVALSDLPSIPLREKKVKPSATNAASA